VFKVRAWGWAKKALAYSFALMLLGFFNQQIELLPHALGLWMFATALWIFVVTSLVFIPYTLFRWARVEEFDRWSYLGVIVALPVLIVWFWIGPTNMGLPALRDISTDISNPPLIEGWDNQLNSSLQRQSYPDVMPILLFEEQPDAVLQQLNMMALRDDWERVGQPRDLEAIYRVSTSALSYHYILAARVKAVPAGTRLDLRVVAIDQQRDFGYGASLIRGIRDELKQSTN
jgi:hypothetical protein